MTRLEIILTAVLALSVVLNVVLVAYTRALIVRLVSISEELGDLDSMVRAFATHLQSVYQLESFYGDETLQALLEHAVSFNEQMGTFDFIISLTQEEEEDTNDNNPEEEENT